jgi:protoporphyrinogen oxidase
MEPLNKKMWTVNPSELSSVWVRHRSGSEARNVPQIRLRRLLRNTVFRKDDLGWSPTSTVMYPATGGTGAIWSKALQLLGTENIRFSSQLSAIETHSRKLTFSNGNQIVYSKLISSIPLDSLLRLCTDRPDLQEMANSLRRSSALLFGFGISGTLPDRYKGVHTFQCPEPELPFWRITIPSNVSPGNVPNIKDFYSVLCEVSCDASDNPEINDQWRELILDALKKIGIIAERNQVVSRFEKVLAHGYPLPFWGRDRVLALIHNELQELQILSRGRFGGWCYEVSNQDHAFMQGTEAVRFLLAGKPELTYPHPRSVN